MTKNFVITCDRADGLRRAAVWRGKELVDLYVDRLDEPDMTGALVRGKVDRVLAGQLTAWVECGLPQKVYCESNKPIKAGDRLCLRIQTTLEQGKAWVGKIAPTPEGVAQESGVLLPPPVSWERAFADLKTKASACLFADFSDYKAFCQSPWGGVQAQCVHQDPLYEMLDDQMRALLSPIVPLSKEAHLVIEKTQALIAIDVNGGQARNASAVNLMAVKEALRQIRLRNLAGLIVIDCLKMKQRTEHAHLIAAAKREAESDPAGTQIFGLTKLGLMEMTRIRRGPSLDLLCKES